jgi:hypothetical protein
MQKKDLIETAILLLGLWSLYNVIIPLFYVVYYYLGELFAASPVYDPAYFSAYITESLSFGILTFLCFAKRPLLLRSLNLAYPDEKLTEKENKTDFLESEEHITTIATKIELIEIGIIVLCLGVLFTALPYFLFAVFTLFKSKIATDDGTNYSLTLPFLRILIPVIIIIARDKIIKLLYTGKEPAA